MLGGCYAARPVSDGVVWRDSVRTYVTQWADPNDSTKMPALPQKSSKSFEQFSHLLSMVNDRAQQERANGRGLHRRSDRRTLSIRIVSSNYKDMRGNEY
jgi:hypothetical protein